jgi:hypothetical protein
MTFIRILVQALILALINLGAIIFGFIIYFVSKAPHQSSIQIPVAVVVSVYAFVLWCRILKSLHVDRLLPKGMKELALICILCLLCAPVIFVPLHYVTQGYLTSFDNIYGIWLFQIPTNFLTLAMVGRLFARRVDASIVEQSQELPHD